MPTFRILRVNTAPLHGTTRLLLIQRQVINMKFQPSSPSDRTNSLMARLDASIHFLLIACLFAASLATSAYLIVNSNLLHVGLPLEKLAAVASILWKGA